MNKEVPELQIEQKQKFMDFIFEDKTIGEARELAGISLEQALAILDNQIKSTQYLEKRVAPSDQEGKDA